MGMVTLDMTFRVEKTLRIRVPKDWLRQLGISWEEPQKDATLAEIHRFVLRLCDEQQVSPPADSWAMLVSIVEAVTGFGCDVITPDTKLIRDIAPHG